MEWHHPIKVGASTFIYVGVNDGVGMWKLRFGVEDSLPMVLTKGPLRHISVEKMGVMYHFRVVMSYIDGRNTDILGTLVDGPAIKWGEERLISEFYNDVWN